MRVLVSGASGLIGRALVVHLRQQGIEAHALVREHGQLEAGDLLWQSQVKLDPDSFSNFDAVVHLAGRPIATRWTESIRQEIRASRVQGTAQLARAVAASYARCGRPYTLVTGSAVGYYGSRGDESLDESSPAGTGFLAALCVDWEAAGAPAREACMRLVQLRTAMVLAPQGGALAKMLPAFRLGLGARLGNGRQWWSWISLDDAVRAIAFVLAHNAVRGPINLAAPAAVTNAEFTQTLARTLHRPTLLTLPDFALRLLVGEMADEMLLASARVVPQALLQAGFRFEDGSLAAALQRLLP